MKTLVTKLGGLLSAATICAAAASSGCSTEAFCFADCQSTTGSSSGSNSSSGHMGGGGHGGTGGDCGLFCTNTGGSGEGGSGGCMETNNGVEICDGVDNDCNSLVDDVDFNLPKNCGTCDNNCFEILINNNPDTISCTPSQDPGVDPGVCEGDCVSDYYDLDNNGTCEYYCVKDDPAPLDDSTCNNKDDDCDGIKDEDVDLCSSITDCGKCGGNCVVLHGTPTCVHTGNDPCGPANTQCQIAQCDDGFWDLDNSYATGCEYQCTPTNNGIEICGDAIDNDCDGKIDGADDLSGDPQIGVSCFGDPDGVCAEPAHVGATICQGTKVVCSGPNVLVENQQPETCNTKDDDCDGVVDDNPTDAGGACGISNVFPCSFGAFQCQNGQLVCIGAIDPGSETCNGEDDDCDGTIDMANGNPPPDSVGDCNVPPPPPIGATSPCKKGAKSCIGGAITCVGSIGPTSPNDGCNIDSNCDGVLSNQPDLTSDVNNCGSCGNDCYANAIHAVWACVNSTCQFQACEPGYYDLNNDNKCEYACSFIQAQEICNGIDDNCNGTIDESVIAPSPVQVCGVSPAATTAECKSPQVSVACQNGTWNCTFPAGVCSPNCATATEICDGLDNDCDGLINENVPNFNKPCVSDEGLAPPGHGACQTTGTYICDGFDATKCGALPANCNSLPGGCTELCDGIDNDCDSIIDEPFSNPGSNAANYVRPAATKISPNQWVFTYEASRPNATNINPGTGNGYWTNAPAGETLDKTAACSEPNKIPWFNVSPREVEQTCLAMGGFVCTLSDWQTACHSKGPTSCKWGYNTSGSDCTTNFLAGQKYCNLGSTYDFSIAQGDQDGLLPTASSLIKNCWADWSDGQTNNKLFDITGNLREITKKAVDQYTLMGGAFNSQSEDGSTCDFTFYTVGQSFKFFDTGFRCCFSSNPAP